MLVANASHACWNVPASNPAELTTWTSRVVATDALQRFGSVAPSIVQSSVSVPVNAPIGCVGSGTTTAVGGDDPPLQPVKRARAGTIAMATRESFDMVTSFHCTRVAGGAEAGGG